MANLGYSIPQLLGAAFGISSPLYITQFGGEAPIANPVFSGTEINLSEFDDTKQSWLGTPIIMPMRFLGGDKLKTLGRDGRIEYISLPPFDLPAATVVDFEREKITSEDQTSSSTCSKKEIWGFTDWKIRFRGFCLNEPNIRTAQEQKEMLLKYENVVESIAVEGQLFDEKLVFNILMKTMPTRQLQGSPNAIPFEIMALSDKADEEEI